MKPVSHTACSSKFINTLSRKCSSVYDPVESVAKGVRFEENSILLSETNVSTKPTSDFSKLDPNFGVLSKTNRSGKIMVKLSTVKQSLNNLVYRLYEPNRLILHDPKMA